MLTLNKWALTDTMLCLSHPERARVVEASMANGATLRQKEADQTRIYAEAYDELEKKGMILEKIYDEFSSVKDFAF